MGSRSATLEAIEAVYRDRSEDFYRFALARTADEAAARDAVQEGFARAIRSRRSFRGDGSLDAWIGRCVLNAARDLIRPAPAPASVGESVDVSEPIHPEVRAAIRRLPDRQREALFLRFYLDFDYARIAEALGIEVGTVSATLHAARAALGATLEEVAR